MIERCVKGMVRRITPQRLLIMGLLLVVAAAAARFFVIEGWFRPVRVVSGSMADRLIGEHWGVACADCGFHFRFGVESPPHDKRAVCPNCGFERNLTQTAARGRGDRVLIDRAAYFFEPPHRYDLVAFRDPQQPVRKIVKRVAGLPGEKMAIRRGDLYANGQLLRKSLSEFRRLAVIVHDNDYLPREDRLLPARWRTDTDASSWRVVSGRFQYGPETSTAKVDSVEPDWLTYHHWRCYANPYPRSAEAPVSDNLGYNQGESRELRQVTDLVLRLTLRLERDSHFLLRIHDGYEWSSVDVDLPKQTVTAYRADQKLHSASWSANAAEPFEVTFGLLDQQIVLGIQDREVLRQPYPPGSGPPSRKSQPIGIGGLQFPFEVGNLVVLRDVHYLDPWSVGQPWSMDGELGADQFLVLGDNPPLSDDSRRWTKPFLSRSAIIGRVVPLPR